MTRQSSERELKNIYQELSIPELITVVALKNYQRIGFLFCLYFLMMLTSPAILKSSGFVGITITGSFISYIHIRFGSLIIGLSVIFVILICAIYFLDLII